MTTISGGKLCSGKRDSRLDVVPVGVVAALSEPLNAVVARILRDRGIEIKAGLREALQGATAAAMQNRRAAAASATSSRRCMVLRADAQQSAADMCQPVLWTHEVQHASI